MTVFIVLHFVKRFLWDCSVWTQYSYYRDFYYLWPESHLRDCAIVGYSPPPGQHVSTIFWNITITVWLKSQAHHIAYYFVLMHEILHQKTQKHITKSLFCHTKCAVLNHRSFRATSQMSVHFALYHHTFEWIAQHIKR